MKTPICEICLKSGILCPGCLQKLKDGEISELDVKISKLLYQLINKYNIPKDIHFIQSRDFDGLVVLKVGKNEVGNIVGKGGKILKILQKDLHRKIRVVEETDDMRKIVQDLVYPARVVGINIVYLPDGTKKKIRVPREDEKRLPIELNKAREIVQNLTNEDVDLVLD